MRKFREYLIFERSREGKVGYSLPALDVPEVDVKQTLGERNVRIGLEGFPEVSEVEVVRHFTRLSQWNFGVDTGMYPLGSCTMKHNPKLNEELASLPGFTQSHPCMPDEDVQGTLKLIRTLETYLSEITGLPSCTLQPAAGAHGEYTGIMLIHAALRSKKLKRTTILVPDSAHGTNPATATLAGFEVKEVPSNDRGQVDMEALKAAVDENTAAMMITNPNTLGIFETQVREIADLLHAHGAYLYMDGANMNALVGKMRPGDAGVDVLHLNLHKTFSTPHGGGGPGSGPVCAIEEFDPFMPYPRSVMNPDGSYAFDWSREASIGKVHGWYGNFGVAIRALCWILSLGRHGLRKHTEHAVLNNNYLRKKLEPFFHLPYAEPTLHETVFTDKIQEAFGVTTMDIAKSLLDFGFHPPTIYFPLVVHGALMIEPTETESRGELDRFADAMADIARRAESDPESVKRAPVSLDIQRPDDTLAARKPVLRWEPQQNQG